MTQTIESEIQRQYPSGSMAKSDRATQSNLGRAIEALMDESEIRQSELARKTGLHNSHLTRLIRKGQTFIERKDLIAISKALTNRPEKAAELIRAHMLDECYGPGSHLVEVRINMDKADAPTWLPNVSALSLKAQRAIQRLVKRCKEQPQLEDLLINLAENITGKDEEV